MVRAGRPRIRRAAVVAAADLVAERGSGGLTTQQVTERAGISQADFEAEFSSLEECLLAGWDEGLSRLRRALSGSRRRARTVDDLGEAIALTFGFLDDEPGWARLLLIELPDAARSRRARALSDLVAWVSDLTTDSFGQAPEPAAISNTAVQLFSSVARAMLDENAGSLAGLAPILTATVVRPCLSPGASDTGVGEIGPDQARPVGRRTRELLLAIRGKPQASSRAIADEVGIENESYARRLLRGLQSERLIQNARAGEPHGQPNAWVLTRHGHSALDACGDERSQRFADGP
jgi:AcrR family transcriptional regulator